MSEMPWRNPLVDYFGKYDKGRAIYAERCTYGSGGRAASGYSPSLNLPHNCIADCSIVPFYDKIGPVVASFACSIVEGPTKLKSSILVQLAVQDTVHLHGKYVYQITIRMPSDSAYGKIDIPLHGILYIGKNIKPEFIGG